VTPALTLTIDEWLEYGRLRGWCSEVVCSTHDGVPTTDEEDERWEAGEDPCMAVVRLWND
jgi:hypothetical protein